MVRRAALRALAEHPGPERWRVLDAANDPHWRVRHALIQVLRTWGESEALRQEIDARLAEAEPDVRVRGVRDYLRLGRSGSASDGPADGPADDPGRGCLFWDWDAAVLARNIERMGELGRRQNIDGMPPLLAHADERVRTAAVDALRRWGRPEHVAQAVALLDDPRSGAGEAAAWLLGSLIQDEAEAAARLILHLAAPSPAQLAWALDQAGLAWPCEESSDTLNTLLSRQGVDPPRVRRALARLAGRWDHPEAESRLRRFLADPDPGVREEALRGYYARGIPPDEDDLRPLLSSPHATLRAEAVRAVDDRGGNRDRLDALAADLDSRVRMRLAKRLARRALPENEPILARLRSDYHPHVRAAALTSASAAALVREPDAETSWHVLAAAARMTKIPRWRFEPKRPWRPERPPPSPAEELRPNRPLPPHARLLGPAGPAVSPLGISGHYGLPIEGFVRAAGAGVNLLFWEPNYQTLTEFLTRLPPPERNALHVVAGTFEADGRRVLHDAERVLRLLKIDRLAVFLVFWVQSWARIAPDVRETLERLKETGKVASFGLSTHSRPLAVEAMEAGWDPVMVRHSAAHRGAESHVLPRAAERGTRVFTFNNTCYGRLLKPRGDSPAPTAADCYRYCLEQPGVTACWSAPATPEQLEENLAALRDPELPADRRRRLLDHGAWVYEEDAAFRRLVRSR